MHYPCHEVLVYVLQDRFTGAGFAGEHGEAATEAELQCLDQGDVFEAQSGEHGRIRRPER